MVEVNCNEKGSRGLKGGALCGEIVSLNVIHKAVSV